MEGRNGSPAGREGHLGQTGIQPDSDSNSVTSQGNDTVFSLPVLSLVRSTLLVAVCVTNPRVPIRSHTEPNLGTGGPKVEGPDLPQIGETRSRVSIRLEGAPRHPSWVFPFSSISGVLDIGKGPGSLRGE